MWVCFGEHQNTPLPLRPTLKALLIKRDMFLVIGSVENFIFPSVIHPSI